MIPDLIRPRLRASRVSSPPRLLSASALVVACGLAACGRVPGQFEIVNNQVPTSECNIPADDTIYQCQGRLDARLVRPAAESAFYVFPMLRNTLPASTEGPDTNQITLTSFAVDISVLTAPPSTAALIDGLNADA